MGLMSHYFSNYRKVITGCICWIFWWLAVRNH